MFFHIGINLSVNTFYDDNNNYNFKSRYGYHLVFDVSKKITYFEYLEINGRGERKKEKRKETKWMEIKID